MRRSFVILAAGIALVAIGFVLLEAATYPIIQSAQEQSFPIAILTLGPNEQESIELAIRNTTRPVYLALSDTDEINNPLMSSNASVDVLVKDPTGRELLSISDALKKTLKVVPTTSGNYSLYLTNKNNEDDAQIMIVGTYGKVPTTGQEILDMAAPAVAGVIMIFVGIPVLIGGGILFAIDMRREKRNTDAPR